MSEERKIQLGVSVNANSAREGFNEVRTGAVEMARGVTRAATDAGMAIDGIGASAASSAQRVEAAERNLIGSIQRATAAAQAGQRSGAAYFEALATQRGVDPRALEPYLAQLRAVESAQNSAGMSARATAAAMRGVPAQITDIATSLQGGASPMTVLFQQGGQLRDMFGSTTGAARALGSSLVGMITPATGLAAAVGAAAFAYKTASDETNAYRNAMVTTGNAAVRTTGQLGEMASQIKATGGTQGEAASALVALIEKGKVGSENMVRFGAIAVQSQRLLGKAVADTAGEFSALGGAPYEASLKLDAQYNYLTLSVLRQIKALQEQGRFEEAAALAQNTYADAMEVRNARIRTSMGTLETAWSVSISGMKGAWDRFVGLFREDTLAEQIEKAQARLKQARAHRFAGPDGLEKEQAAEKNLQKLKDAEERERRLGEAQKEVNRAKEAGQKWDEEGLKYLSRREQLERELEKARNMGKATATTGTDPAETEELIAKRILLIRKAFSDIYNGQIDSQIEAIKRRGQIEEEAAKRSVAALTTAYTASNAGSTDSQISYLQSTEALDQAAIARERARLQEQLALTAQKANSEKEQASIRGQMNLLEEQSLTRQAKLKNDIYLLEVKTTRKGAEDFANVYDKASADSESIRKQVQAQRDYNDQIGLSASAIVELEAARLEAQASRKEENATIAEGIDLTGQLSQQYRDQAKELRDLAAEKRSGAAKDLAVKQAEEVSAAWKRTSQEISSGLTDALMRGFEAGKSFAQNLRDTVVNMFKTMVVKPTIQATLMPGSAGSGGVMGAVQTASGLGNAYQAFAGVGGTVLGVGNLVGSSTISAFGAGLSGGAGVADAVAAYNAAGMTSVGSAMSFGSSISTAIAAIPGWGWAALGAAAIAASLLNSGPEKDTRLKFGSNNAAGAISINERGNEGKVGQSYIDGSSTGAFGSFGVTSSFWMDARQPAVQSFIQTVTKVDDQLSRFLSDSEKASVTAAVTATSTTAHTGAEGDNPNGNGQLDAVFAERMRAIFDGISPGLSSLIAGFKGTSEALATEAATLLEYRRALGDASEAVFGATVTLQDLAALKAPSEATSAALQRVTAEFNATNAAAAAVGRDASDAFGAVGLASLSARERLILFAGGVDQLSQQTAFFSENFLSKADRIAPVAKQVQAQLVAMGWASVDTRDQFAAMVRGIDLATEAGAKQYAQAMALAPAFAQVHDAMAAATDVVKQRADLEYQILELTQGSSVALAAKRQQEVAAMDASLRPLAERLHALQDEKSALEAAKATAASLVSDTDSALGVVQRIVNREKAARSAAHDAEIAAINKRIEVVTGSITKIKSLSDSLHSTLDQMRAPGMEAAERQSAQAQIKAALAIARAGGPLPDSDSLKRALSIVSQDASNQFATFADYQRDFYSTASDIASLGEITDSSLDVQEKQLNLLQDQKDASDAAYKAEIERLDGVIEAGQEQIDQLKGINVGMLSLSQALAAFQSSVLSASQNSINASNMAIQAAYQSALGRTPDAAGLAFYQNAAASGVSTAQIVDSIKTSTEAQLVGLYQSVLGRTPDAGGLQWWMQQAGSGVSMADIKSAFLSSDEYKRLHPFAVGTNFVPADMPAYIHEGERIIPAADNRELMARLNSPPDSNRAEVELRAVTRVLEQIAYSSSRSADGSARLTEIFERNSAGGGPLLVRMEVA